MRSLGVRSIFATCDCGRYASVDVSALPDAVTVPAPRWRLRCSSCGAYGRLKGSDAPKLGLRAGFRVSSRPDDGGSVGRTPYPHFRRCLTSVRLDGFDLIMEGAALLALLVQAPFELVERYLVPRGLRLKAGIPP